MASPMCFRKCEAVGPGSGSDGDGLQMGRHTVHHGAEKAYCITPVECAGKETVDNAQNTE